MNISNETLFLKLLLEEKLDSNYISWLEACECRSQDEISNKKESLIKSINPLMDYKIKLTYGVYLKENNQHIGDIALQNLDIIDNNAEISLSFQETKYYDNGCIYEAGKLLINYAFNILKLHRLSFSTSATNNELIKLAEKLNFKEEGVLKDNFSENNKFYDGIVYGLVNQNNNFSLV